LALDPVQQAAACISKDAIYNAYAKVIIRPVKDLYGMELGNGGMPTNYYNENHPRCNYISWQREPSGAGSMGINNISLEARYENLNWNSIGTKLGFLAFATSPNQINYLGSPLLDPNNVFGVVSAPAILWFPHTLVIVQPFGLSGIYCQFISVEVGTNIISSSRLISW